MPRSAFAWAAYALAWMTVIFILSSIPGTVRPEDEEYYRVFLWLPPQIQNLLHIPVFGVLSWLWLQAFQCRRLQPRHAAAAAILLTGVYGVLDEWHQSFVPGRYGSFTDLSLDVLGALLGVLVGLRLRRRSGYRNDSGA